MPVGGLMPNSDNLNLADQILIAAPDGVYWLLSLDDIARMVKGCMPEGYELAPTVVQCTMRQMIRA